MAKDKKPEGSRPSKTIQDRGYGRQDSGGRYNSSVGKHQANEEIANNKPKPTRLASDEPGPSGKNG